MTGRIWVIVVLASCRDENLDDITVSKRIMPLFVATGDLKDLRLSRYYLSKP